MNGRTLIRVAVCAGIALGAVAFVSSERANAGTVPRRAPKTIEIKMTSTGGMKYDPAEVTVIPGDTVKWVAAGGSHNVQFWADSVPTAAVAMLKKDIGNDTLATVRYPTAGTGFSLVMKDYPKGVYKYFCTPHLRRGMVAKLTVE